MPLNLESISLARQHTEETWELVSRKYTNYALQHVIRKFIPVSANFQIASARRGVDGRLHMPFDVYCIHAHGFLQTVTLREEIEGPSSRVTCHCTCLWSSVHGLACAHMFRVFVVASEWIKQKLLVDLSSAFHSYWLRDGGGWRVGQPFPSVSHGARDNLDLLDENERENIRQEREAQALWSSGHSSWNFIHSRVAANGLPALRELDKNNGTVSDRVFERG